MTERNRPLQCNIVLGGDIHPVERYAAQELSAYIRRLSGQKLEIHTADRADVTQDAIVLGTPTSNALVARFARGVVWEDLLPDGYVLRTVGQRPAVLLLAGAAPRAVLYAVYEFLESLGVRFSLSGDHVPGTIRGFQLNGYDVVRQPSYHVRTLQCLQNLPEGAGAWDLSDYLHFIDQMAKLRYNTFAFSIMESGPWLDYEFRGVQRPAGDIFYGWKYPIDERFVGREVFGDRKEFYSPILARAHNEQERKQAGIELVRKLMEHCQQRDMKTMLAFGLMEPPTALKHKVNDWASFPLPDQTLLKDAHFSVTPTEELGTNPKYAAWMNVLDPVVRELTECRLRALMDTYASADYYCLWVSEHRTAVVDYREIVRRLDARHSILRHFDLEGELRELRGFPYGLQRKQHQIKGDMFFLYLFDLVFNERTFLSRISKPEAQIVVGGLMPELGPVAARVLPPGTHFEAFLDYGTHGTALKLDQLKPLFDLGVTTHLSIGVHDDNTMWFPQVSFDSLQQILDETTNSPLEGYVALLWQVRQGEANAEYLARGSWSPPMGMDHYYAHCLSPRMGPEATDGFRAAMQLLERADREIKRDLYGFAFAFQGALQSKLKGVNREAVGRTRRLFVQALHHLRLAEEKSSDEGRALVGFWIRCTEFAVAWLDMGMKAADLGQIVGPDAAYETRLSPEQREHARHLVEQLFRDSEALIHLIVPDARHLGDLGQIAALNQHVVAYLRKLQQLLTSGSGTTS